MAQTAIIDISTRVIKRLTTDSNPPVSSTEKAIVVPSPIIVSSVSVLNGDNATTTPATLSQIQQAGLDETFNAQQAKMKISALKTAIQNLQSDATVPSSIRQVFTAFLQTLG